jgi:hypothetical protein
MRTSLCIGAVILFAAALSLAGCGGSSSLVAQPTQQQQPFPTPAAASTTVQATIASGASTVTLPTVAGISGTLALSIDGISNATPLTFTVSTRPTTGVSAPNAPTLLYVSFTLPAGAALTGPPQLNLTLPSLYPSGIVLQAALIGDYSFTDGAGNLTPLSKGQAGTSNGAKKPQDTTPPTPPNLATLWVAPPGTPSPTPGATPTPTPNSTPTPYPFSQVVPSNGGPVTIAAVAYSFTAPLPYPSSAANLELNSGQSGTFVVTQTANGNYLYVSDPIALAYFATLCSTDVNFGPGDTFRVDPSDVHIQVQSTASQNGNASYTVSATLDPSDATYNYFAQLNNWPYPVYCFVNLRDIKNNFSFEARVDDLGALATPTPTPALTPDATATTNAVTLYTGMNDLSTRNAQIPVPAQGFTSADLSLPGVSSQVTGTLTVSVGRSNFAPSMFPAALSGTPLELISVTFSQPFSFVSATASGLSSDLCFPSSLITASSYTFTYYANGTSLGSVPATIASNDGTCTNVHLSGSSTPLGSLPANSTGFGLVISSP